MCRPMPAQEVIKTVTVLQENSRIPMLIAANLESGGVEITPDGTKIGSQMQIAATDDEGLAYKLGVACAREASSLGANWSFAPIIDIDYNFRNPITNTRTFGSDPERVRRMALAYIRGVQENGVAAAIKHFPGDGVDERDQHLVTSVNDLSCEEWDNTYGAIYSACIEAGSMSVMVGHIAQPNYSKKLNLGIDDTDILPTTLSYDLTTRLLREHMGFNGLIVSDASTMAGIYIQLPREKAVLQVIAAGCDIFLFTRNLDEDFVYIKKGVQTGIITQKRLDEAVERILAFKAALKLHQKKREGTLIPSPGQAKFALRKDEYNTWAKECADKSITLVKEEKGVLPISKEKYKRILFYPVESDQGFIYTARIGAADTIRKLLIKEGFEVDTFKPGEGAEGMVLSYQTIVDHYDLILYVANMATKSNQTVVRIEWQQPMGANVSGLH